MGFESLLTFFFFYRMRFVVDDLAAFYRRQHETERARALKARAYLDGIPPLPFFLCIPSRFPLLALLFLILLSSLYLLDPFYFLLFRRRYNSTFVFVVLRTPYLSRF